MVGDWLGEAFQKGSDNWQSFLMPSLGLSAALVAMVMLILVPTMLMAGVLGAVSEELMIGVMVLLVTVCAMGAAFLFSPALLGFYRGTLAVMRGEGWPAGALFSGYSQAFSVWAVTLLSQLLVIGGLMLCFLPGVLVGSLMLFTLPVMADERCGPIEAMKRSAELAQPQLWTLTGYWILANFISSLVTQLPLVGLLLAFPLQALMVCAPYLALKRAAQAQPSSA